MASLSGCARAIDPSLRYNPFGLKTNTSAPLCGYPRGGYLKAKGSARTTLEYDTTPRRSSALLTLRFR